MHSLHFTDMTALGHGAFEYELMIENPDAVLNIETHLFNVILGAKRSSLDFDIGKGVWLHIGRWSRLVKEYIERGALKRFIGQTHEILERSARDGATANFMFRDPKRYAKKHRWGGCLMGASFVGAGERSLPTLTFFSRTTYCGYMMWLDLALAHVMIKEIVEPYENYEVEDISFLWHITSMQFHHFKSLPFVYSTGLVKEILQGTTPAAKGLRSWQQKIEQQYKEQGEDMVANEKYGPFKRIKRRWLEHKGVWGPPPPSLPVSTLTFEKAIEGDLK